MKGRRYIFYFSISTRATTELLTSFFFFLKNNELGLFSSDEGDKSKGGAFTGC